MVLKRVYLSETKFGFNSNLELKFVISSLFRSEEANYPTDNLHREKQNSISPERKSGVVRNFTII